MDSERHTSTSERGSHIKRFFSLYGGDVRATKMKQNRHNVATITFDDLHAYSPGKIYVAADQRVTRSLLENKPVA